MATVAILGAFDTKGEDFAFLKRQIEERGFDTLTIDFSVIGESAFAADVSRGEVAEAGDVPLETLQANADRGDAMRVMSAGAAEIVRRLYAQERIDAIISMGGGGGTTVASNAMRALPVGFPKLIVSTVASGETSPFIGTSDIVLMPSVIDVAGLNRISRLIYANAAGAICGMIGASNAIAENDEQPMVAISMFGNTTAAVNHAKSILEDAGYEVLIFHATGTGGRTMEMLISEGQFAAVLDMTTTEWADELVGGMLTAGAERLDAAALNGVPQIVVPGCIDMVNFWGRESVPSKFADRTFYEWNANVTLMRTTPDETARLGKIFAEKLNRATAPVAVYIPLGGVSEIDVAGKPFYSPDALRSFADALRANLRPDIPVVEMDTHINDPSFSGETARALLGMVKAGV
jgi:uncharacterized protein (UPF0261 family)